MLFAVGTPVRVAPSYQVLLHTLTGRDLAGETLTVAGRMPNGVTVRNTAGDFVTTRQGTELVCEDTWLKPVW